MNTSLSYYDIGKNYTFEIYISGYPLPNVKLSFKKCPYYPKCEQSNSETLVIFFVIQLLLGNNNIHKSHHILYKFSILCSQGIKNETIKVSEIALILVISMNATESGTFTCGASNLLGNDIRHYTVLVTGMSKVLSLTHCMHKIIIVLLRL